MRIKINKDKIYREKANNYICICLAHPMTGPLRTLIPDHCKFRGLRKDDEKWFLRIGEVTVVLHRSEGRLFYRYSTFCGSS